MSYPQEWRASTDPDDESGTATFTVEGIKYTFDLANFEAFRSVSTMLDSVFLQGKVFAAAAMRGHVEQSLDKAERDHGLL